MLKPLVPKFHPILLVRLKDIAEKRVPAELKPIVSTKHLHFASMYFDRYEDISNVTYWGNSSNHVCDINKYLDKFNVSFRCFDINVLSSSFSTEDETLMPKRHMKFN